MMAKTSGMCRPAEGRTYGTSFKKRLLVGLHCISVTAYAHFVNRY